NWTSPYAIASIAVIIGILALGTALLYVYRWKRSKDESISINPLRWWGPKKVHRMRAHQNVPWTIDRAEEADAFVEEARRSHTRLPPGETLKGMESRKPASKFPVMSSWKGLQIMQHIRRLPDQLPLPWRKRAVYIVSRPPGRRFRMDSLSRSAESGEENARDLRAARPKTIYESGEVIQGSQLDNPVYPDDEPDDTSLISPIDRSENHVFLITNRPGEFSLESDSSISGDSQRGRYHSAINPSQRPPASAKPRLSIQLPPLLKPSQHSSSRPDVQRSQVDPTEYSNHDISSSVYQLRQPPHIRQHTKHDDDQIGILKMGGHSHLPTPCPVNYQPTINEGLSSNQDPVSHVVSSRATMNPGLLDGTRVHPALKPSAHLGQDNSSFLKAPSQSRLPTDHNRPIERNFPIYSDAAMLYSAPVRSAGYTINANESLAGLRPPAT
ncbi:hypothetical protein H0H81_011339, partial [Sphagnurus paluster]